MQAVTQIVCRNALGPYFVTFTIFGAKLTKSTKLTKKLRRKVPLNSS
jgi:hypothetical protein